MSGDLQYREDDYLSEHINNSASKCIRHMMKYRIL